MFKSSQVYCGLALGMLSLGLVQAADRPLRMVDEGGADKDWAPASNAPPVEAPYPVVSGAKDDVCVSIGYKINRDGKTSDLSLLKVWSSATPDAEPNAETAKPFVQSAAAAIALWRFEAKPDASSNRIVYTSASIPFVGDKGSAADSIRGHCRISDLKAYVAKLQNEANRRGNLDKDGYERTQRQYSPNQQALIDAANRTRRGL